MVKKISAVLLVVFVLCLSLAAPFSALVIDRDNYEDAKNDVFWELYNTSLQHGMESPLPFGYGSFTRDPRIVYNNSDFPIYDGNGYTAWVAVPAEEYNSDIEFGILFGSDSIPGYYPTFQLDQSLDVGRFKIIYKHFTIEEYASIFSRSLMPDVFNMYIGSGITGLYTQLYWGFSVGYAWMNFLALVDNLASYENGVDYGAEVIENFLTLAEPSLEYYFQGAWYQIEVDFPEDLTPYVTYDAVYLNLLQNLGLTAADIPANNGGVRLCFEIQRPINVAGFRFGAYNPSNIIRRYDPGDVRSERFGVFFSNSEQSYTLYPMSAVEEDGDKYWFTYSPYANRVYDQISIELNYQVLINVLNNAQTVTDYIEYQLIDYNEPFDAGYSQGFQDGRYEGEKVGEKIGYQNGYQDGLSIAENSDFYSLFTAIIDVPIQAFYGLLEFDFLGVNLSSFVLSILTVVLVVLVLKKVIL